MSGRRWRVRIETDTARDRMVIRGWRAGELAREAGCWPIFSGTVGGWIIDLPHLADLVAYCEHRHVAVSVTEVGDAA